MTSHDDIFEKESVVELVDFRPHRRSLRPPSLTTSQSKVKGRPTYKFKYPTIQINEEQFVNSEDKPDSINSNNLAAPGIELTASKSELHTVPSWAILRSQEDLNEGAGEQRETWDSKVDFLLSLIGFAVDLANVWRFPYLCYKNGGGAFLIPYFIMLIFGAVPMFFMELVLGQCHRKGCIAIWKLVPLFRGVGICQCFIAVFVSFYYNVIIAWSVYYLFSSLTLNLPWTSCGNYWNTDNCHETREILNNSNNESVLEMSSSPTQEFFERRVLGLHLSNGLEDIGSPRWELVLCLLAVFVVIYFSIWKGVKTSGKVVWVTATMPYVVLTILLIRGVMLPGSADGILYFVTPRMSRLKDPHVWIDAAVQIFYSVGAGFGVHMAFASYNKLNHNCYRDCLITVAVNSFTSLYSGIVIFSYLGYMAASQNKDISAVAAEGPGLVFVVYPEAIATLPGSTFWSILFFIMLITLGLDSAMGGLEALLTGLKDVFENQLKDFKYAREVLTLVVVIISFLLALSNVTNGGMYLVTMWDTFAAGTSILFGVFAEVVAVAWFYGLEEFCEDIYHILRFRPSIYWRFCWKFVSPIFLLTIIISSIASFTPLRYSSYTMGEYIYPWWANILGWIIAATSMSCVPLVAIYGLCRTKGTFREKIAINISPYWEHDVIRNEGLVKRFERNHWFW